METKNQRILTELIAEVPLASEAELRIATLAPVSLVSRVRSESRLKDADVVYHSWMR